MRKSSLRFLAALAVGLGGIVVLSSTAFAADLKLDWQRQLQPKMCDASGRAIIDVKESVSNDADSGQQGNTWALDKYTRDIKVFNVSGNTYCAVVTYDGTSTTISGLAPGPTGSVPAGLKVDMSGGYRATIVGTLLADPLWRTHGNVGKFDYMCNIDPSCPGIVSWPDQYFTAGYTFNEDWWGWIYKASDDQGTWINSIEGNQGNITSSDDQHGENA